jgi:hypothetical protein
MTAASMGCPLTGRRAHRNQLDPDPLPSQAPALVRAMPLFHFVGCRIETARAVCCKCRPRSLVDDGTPSDIPTQAEVNGHKRYDIVYVEQLSTGATDDNFD